MFRLKQTFRIMFSDCDPAKLMYYPRYFQWFDRASQQLFNEVGLSWNATWEKYNMAGFPLVDASAKFFGPARMDEFVELETWIDEWRGRTFVVKHVVSRDGETLLEGQEIRAWAVHDPEVPKGIRAAEIPEEVKARFEV
ncbi:MAG: thioesterase family protein [Rhodospirillales bacterium]|nr:4-hydroxybenzoyl-CoA thioesterase [Rhodospirillaceae bacterium]MDP6428972.1 thioesterase family protein [Rhodospirillales bacterium]MDP6645287.1 thioesterase family protein [Rhodospirillales bacterium]MDP6842760.1 thioesterase family protein [Rhodospirillales bacterium]|tara:strand:- start:2598 stop:3014 length:417 start_codon:yes stop_codon:yes gene_type:complete